MKVGLLFGSYNPVHFGHLLMASRMLDYSGFDEIWLVVSPHNPHKNTEGLADAKHRLEMVRLATHAHLKIKPCDIEFSLSKPSYTAATLKELSHQFPAYHFSLLLGADNLEKLDTWKEVEWIKKNYTILVYDRQLQQDAVNSPIPIIRLPLLGISATEIRNRIQMNKSIRYYVPEVVENYIYKNQLYQ